MDLDVTIPKECMQLAFALLLHDVNFTGFMAKPPTEQFLIAAIGGLTPDSLLTAVEQLRDVVRTHTGVMKRSTN